MNLINYGQLSYKERQIRKLLIFILILVIIIGSIFLSRKYKYTGVEFCDFEINGRVDSIKFGVRGNYYIKVQDNWYYLSNYILARTFNVSINDTIIKRKDCYKVYLKKEGITYDISYKGYEPCDCD